MQEARYTDADTTTTIELSNLRQTKILTASHFAFGRQQEEGAYSGGGPYMFDGETYTEIIDFHSNSDYIGDTLTFNARLEGDSLWYHTGKIGENFQLYEVWLRIAD